VNLKSNNAKHRVFYFAICDERLDFNFDFLSNYYTVGNKKQLDDLISMLQLIN
jgi:hypothetical protein